MTDEKTASNEQDIKEILAVHEAWMYSNNGLEIDKMKPNFADPGYLQFNLNGFTYNGIDEKVKLWEGFHAIGFDLEGLTNIEEPVIYAEGDLAYLTAIWSAKVTGTEASGFMQPDAEPVVLRVTEVYRRNDGKGKPEWKIWHFHASPVAPADAVKFPQDA